MGRALSYGLLFVVLAVTAGCVQHHRYPLNAFYQYD